MHLYEAGVPLPYIRDILGHVDLSATEIYARASTEAKRKVQELQELGEVAGLVVLDADLEVIRQAPAVPGGAEQVHPGAVGAAGAAGGLAVHGDGPEPAAGQRFGLLRGAPGTVPAHAGRRRPAGTPAPARARPEQGPGQRRGSSR